MEQAQTLEEDILDILWNTESALSAAKISQVLKKRHQSVPPDLILKLMALLEKAGILRVTGGTGWGKCYRPTLSKEEFYLKSSEHLVLRCLQAEGAQIEKFVHVDIVNQFSHLEFNGEEE